MKHNRRPALSAASSSFDVVVIAASAGGIEAVRDLLSALPKDFPSPILIVQHLGPGTRYASKLDIVLQRITCLRVKWAEEAERIRPGVVFLAPQDRQLIIEAGGIVHLIAQARVNRIRPAADPLFSSVAAHYGPRAIAVVLSGALGDGAVGAWNIASGGGRVLVQDRTSSQFFDMPQATINTAGMDFMFSPRILARTLVVLTMVAGGADWFRVWRTIPSGRDDSAAKPAKSLCFASPLSAAVV